MTDQPIGEQLDAYLTSIDKRLSVIEGAPDATPWEDKVEKAIDGINKSLAATMDQVAELSKKVASLSQPDPPVVVKPTPTPTPTPTPQPPSSVGRHILTKGVKGRTGIQNEGDFSFFGMGTNAMSMNVEPGQPFTVGDMINANRRNFSPSAPVGLKFQLPNVEIEAARTGHPRHSALLSNLSRMGTELARAQSKGLAPMSIPITFCHEWEGTWPFVSTYSISQGHSVEDVAYGITWMADVVKSNGASIIAISSPNTPTNAQARARMEAVITRLGSSIDAHGFSNYPRTAGSNPLISKCKTKYTKEVSAEFLFGWIEGLVGDKPLYVNETGFNPANKNGWPPEELIPDYFAAMKKYNVVGLWYFNEHKNNNEWLRIFHDDQTGISDHTESVRQLFIDEANLWVRGK